MQKGITVIICCYNSRSRLQATLEHLALQEINSIPWEIILVDNASTDHTAAFAQQTWHAFRRNDVPLKTITEKQQGLSLARKRGVEAAGYEYIIFCDDDNWLKEDYLAAAFDIMHNNKTIGALGGHSTAISDVPLPDWFNEYAEGYAIGKQAAATGIINNKGYVCGAGMVTRKKIFQNAVNNELPNLLTDRKGQILSSGGDCEYCFRIMLQGYNIYYSEQLVLQHYMPQQRLTVTYRDALFKGFEESRRVASEYMEAIKIKNTSISKKVFLLFAAAKDFLKSFMKQRKARSSSYKLIYYLFNIGYRNRDDLKMIKHFYKEERRYW